MSTATQTPPSRREQLREISRLEDQLQAAKQALPSAIGMFFRFRSNHEKSLWIYGHGGKPEAEEKLKQRINELTSAALGKEDFTPYEIHPTVDVMHCAHSANAECNLFTRSG